jgi:hypothetical protein
VGGFDQRQLRLLRCWYNRRTQRFDPPSENTLRRVLGGVDPVQFDRIVGDWVRAHGRVAARAIDGKTLKACLAAEGRQTTLVAAEAYGDGAPLAQIPAPAGTGALRHVSITRAMPTFMRTAAASPTPYSFGSIENHMDIV